MEMFPKSMQGSDANQVKFVKCPSLSIPRLKSQKLKLFINSRVLQAGLLPLILATNTTAALLPLSPPSHTKKARTQQKTKQTSC